MHRHGKPGKQEADMRDWGSRGGLKHRQASRSRPARKGVVERRDFVPAEYELAGRGVVGGMLRRRGFWNREHGGRAGEERERDLARRRAMRFGDRLQDLSGVAARLRKIMMAEWRIGH